MFRACRTVDRAPSAAMAYLLEIFRQRERVLLDGLGVYVPPLTGRSSGNWDENSVGATSTNDFGET